MQRSMSYRKPVPTYIPSPPSSPVQSTFPSPVQPNLDLEIPPLPPNWREVLDQVSLLPPGLPSGTEERVEMDMTDVALSVVSECHIGSNVTADEGKAAIPVRASTRSTLNVPSSQKRRLHQQYRPPTPPIPSPYKSRQSLLSPDNNNNSEVTLNHDVSRPLARFGLYPRGEPGASSLKISSSFRTDKSMGSFNTSNPSGWFQSMATEGLSDCPSLLNDERDRNLYRIAGDSSELVYPSCQENLGAWAKKLWNFVIICK